MALAVDSSSPSRYAGTPAQPGTITSAAFTAPANSFFVVCVNFDSDGGGQSVTMSVSDTGGGLTWAEKVRRDNAETTAGGFSSIWTAAAVSSLSRQVQVTWTSGAAGGSDQMSAKVYAVTSVDLAGTPVDAVGVDNEGGSLTNQIATTAIVPGANGLLFVCDLDWTASGLYTSSDLTIDTADYGTFMSVCSGYKACTSGVSVSGDLNAAGSGAVQHKWCQIIVREAAAAAAVPMGGGMLMFGVGS